MTIEELMRTLEDHVLHRFYGKYAAVVADVDDPLSIGRLRAQVPAVFGEDQLSGWALPCAPFGGGHDRGMLTLPEVGDTLWMEFAGGDPSQPIWVGAFWGAPESVGDQDDLGEQSGSEVPTHEDTPSGPGLLVIKTRTGHRIVLDDNGEVVILAHGSDGAEVRLTASGEVIVKADTIKLGEAADQALVLGDAFKDLFNQHTHPTGVGPSGPPTNPMMPTHLSSKTSTE